jgi:hypothetical protein
MITRFRLWHFSSKHVGSNCTQEGISEQSEIFAKRFVKSLRRRLACDYH